MVKRPIRMVLASPWRLGLVAAVVLVGLALGARGTEVAVADETPQSSIPVTITIPKTQFNLGERFRACFTFPTPASIVITQKIEGQRTVFQQRKTFGDPLANEATQQQECMGIVAGALDASCTRDSAGLEGAHCQSGESGTECLHIVALSTLAAASSQRLILVQQAQACYSVG